MQLANPEVTATNVEYFINLKLAREGVYWIEILLEGDLKLRYPLRVNRVTPPSPSAGGAMPA